MTWGLLLTLGEDLSGDPLSDGRRCPPRRLPPEPSPGEVGEGSLRCERIDIAILHIKLSSRIAFARKGAAVRRRIVKRGHATVEKSCLALVLRTSAGTAQAEAAKESLPTGRMLQSAMFGSNVHAAQVDFRLLRIRSASQLETDGDVSQAPQRAAEKTGMKSVDDPFANEKTL
jgi:hypothetical protein